MCVNDGSNNEERRVERIDDLHPIETSEKEVPEQTTGRSPEKVSMPPWEIADLGSTKSEK